MTLHPNVQSRERILTIGGPGVGKTTGWLTIADRLQAGAEKAGETSPRFFALDTEPSQAVQRALDTDFTHLTNVELATTWDWEDYQKNVAAAVDAAGPDDWLIVDLYGSAWEAVQGYYIERIFGKNADEFWVTARAADKKGSPLDGYKDWGVINKLYNAWTNRLIRFPGHVYCTAAVQPVSQDQDSKEIRNLFGMYGVKPVAQKHTGHLFHTVLWLTAPKPGDWSITTCKDRGRKLLEAEPMRDFVSGYLIRTAGWRP